MSGNVVDATRETVFTQGMTNDTTTEIDDAALDAVADALTLDPQAPSVIARRAHVSTVDAYRALRWLTDNRMAVPIGNGSWKKYRNRHFGEAI